MAEAIGLAASVIAVVEIAGRIASVCKSLIETVRDYPRDLRLIFVETGSLKVIFESLLFLNEDDPADSVTLQRLRGSNGPVEGCKAVMDQLNRLFPSDSLRISQTKGANRQKLQTTLTSLAWPLKAERARKLLDEMMRYKSTISVALQGQLLTELRNMKHQLDEVNTTLDASAKQKVYEWYQGTSPSSFHNAAKRLYEDKTGDWVLRSSDWDDWINARIRSLWIHGIPGAGKTVLAAHTIETILRICEAKDKRTTCVYYYCYHGHNQDESVPCLRWLVSQLLRQADKVPTLAWKVYHSAREPDTTLLLEVLHEVLDCFDRVYVAVDALDESQSRQNLLDVLNVLVTDLRFGKIQLLTTSREYSDIKLKMDRVSRSLSMSNCFVEADIRIYVAVKVASEAKFRRWPSDLRTEVETTLSTGAKGMFRWAVCQLDILRRLNHHSKIREAIKSLPKTLDETYERIFSYIADEEKELVRHTLHWVCFNNLVWKGSVPLPAGLLIDTYALNEGKSPSSSDEYLYDLETLKESCGCLVSFTFEKDDEPQLVANIAHYTVREFLEANRSSLTYWFNIQPKARYGLILAFVLEYAITSKPIEIPHSMWDSGFPFGLGSTSSLQEYCYATSVRSLQNHEELVEPRLAFRLLSPLEGHFQPLCTAICQLSLDGDDETLNPNHLEIGFWDVNWDEPTNSSMTAVLANLLSLKRFSLAKAFIQDLDMKSILQETLYGSIWAPTWTKRYRCESKLNCNLVEFLADIHGLDKDILDFFQREASGLVCYTNLLPRFMPGHRCVDVCEASCTLRQLLQLGANPDPEGFPVTPLQIAVFSRDLAGVRTLLEARADLNNTGDEQATKWYAEPSTLGPYIRLQGLPPLCILRQLEAFLYEDPVTAEEINHFEVVTADIERLLLDYDTSTVSLGD
ncbi:hypothetical protein LTR20_010069 [Exophiala xenobiotica]|nr:hypothetical protein LTR20_010069 [Exophiala xenobiotica]